MLLRGLGGQTGLTLGLDPQLLRGDRGELGLQGGRLLQQGRLGVLLLRLGGLEGGDGVRLLADEPLERGLRVAGLLLSGPGDQHLFGGQDLQVGDARALGRQPGLGVADLGLLHTQPTERLLLGAARCRGEDHHVGVLLGALGLHQHGDAVEAGPLVDLAGHPGDDRLRLVC